MVKVRLYHDFQRVAGKTEISITADTVDELLSKLVGEYEDFGELLFLDQDSKELRNRGTRVNIFVNEQSIRMMNGLETKLNEDDTVRIFPTLAGG
ncbi:hypothetical protein AKJ61_03105 [candidate division MSBL1 archaeon SCGC-AAA259B11]|uniref:MoaD family protein n=1 Tax=candidate division MSBL1 archaeon SCGC-AAA259B11 TaxID=1698260 RepID=A0A133U571_9EURY|nr:hypothetical protein AKJ61_03105 [candidate division MSBL1 archaeon SCGC-AAA259B11]